MCGVQLLKYSCLQVTLSLKPLVVEVENFLLPAENAHIISRAQPHMAKSGVQLKDADKGKVGAAFTQHT